MLYYGVFFFFVESVLIVRMLWLWLDDGCFCFDLMKLSFLSMC